MVSTTLKSRKFIMAMSTLFITSFLVWTGKIDDGVYSAVIIAVVGAYFAANVYQKSTGNAKIDS